jgi:hypothetical protein
LQCWLCWDGEVLEVLLSLVLDGLYANLPHLEHLFETLAPGTVLYIELVVTDFDGNSKSLGTIQTP